MYFIKYVNRDMIFLLFLKIYILQYHNYSIHIFVSLVKLHFLHIKHKISSTKTRCYASIYNTPLLTNTNLAPLHDLIKQLLVWNTTIHNPFSIFYMWYGNDTLYTWYLYTHNIQTILYINMYDYITCYWLNYILHLKRNIIYKTPPEKITGILLNIMNTWQ